MILVDKNSINILKKIISKYNKYQSIRIYKEADGWGGPRFGLALSEQRINDIVEEVLGVRFVVDKDLYKRYGEFKIKSYRQGINITQNKLK